MTYTPQQTFFWWSNQEDGIGGECST